MELSIQKEIKDTTTILHLDGILDITTTNLIELHLQVLEEDIQLLVFNFTSLEFLDSTGIGSIINAIHLSQEKQFKLKFEGVNEITNEVFEMVGIYKILEALQGECN
ncbi:STAS domain-containing protein [Pullulanibacillus sp. KACC 23026]|uniref:STAS domain-containing protein n=1 Tax=Pullulanibacillus sp. KACC 23026 TaxID=3028315 RepID=UPI0023B05153|nr:STAS domain-containing protein [Pullulanibacillus sp. KACC 23026]WEG12465.1 STAS domain-containing protein [Pullulanibacillus sp. KACC 23026]